MKRFTFLILLLLLSGCGEKKPDGMPKLYPVILTFTQEGQPCAGASVTLSPTDNNPWNVGGATGSDGTVNLRTYGKFSGVPQGKYKVIVQKVEREGDIDSPASMWDNRQEVKLFDTVDTKFALPETAPELEVGTSKTVQTFELGKKIRTPVKKPPM